MRKQILYPVLAVVLGGLGAALRMWQRLAGYDAGGLPVAWSVPAVVLGVFLAVCAIMFCALAFRQPKTLEDQPGAIPTGDAAAMLFLAAGVLTLVGGALQLFAIAGDYQGLNGVLYASTDERGQALRDFFFANILNLVLAAASVPTAVALLYQGKRAKSGGENNSFTALMPAIFVWIWLIEAYRQHTANPILWDYVLFLLAVVALLVSGYYRAGFFFGVGKPRRAVFTSLLALFFAAAALPDCGGPAPAALLLAMALHALAELSGLLNALIYRPRRLAAEGEPDPQ